MKRALSSLWLLLICLSTTAAAETRYISDQLVVTVRTSTGDNYKILEKLTTDSPVEVLEDDGNFVQVKTEKGNTGYIRTQFVSKNRPKPLQIAELKNQLATIQTQLQQERQNCQESTEGATANQSEIDQLTIELQRTEQQLAQVTKDYEGLRERSKDVLDLMTAYDVQSEENSRLSNELAVLQDENKNFHRSNMIRWFLAGGAVFFGGWLAGKISRRKRGFSRL